MRTTRAAGGLLVHVAARSSRGWRVLQLFLIADEGSHLEHLVAGHPAASEIQPPDPRAPVARPR